MKLDRLGLLAYTTNRRAGVPAQQAWRQAHNRTEARAFWNQYAHDVEDDVVTIRFDGRSYVVKVDDDECVRPEDFDCYSPEDIESFNAGRWGYIWVEVTSHQTGISTSVGGIESGILDDGWAPGSLFDAVAYAFECEMFAEVDTLPVDRLNQMTA